VIVTYDATHDHGLCVECGEVAVLVEWLPCGNGRCEDCARGCCYDPDLRGFETISIALAEVETLWGESCGDVATLCQSERNVFDEIRADLAAEGVQIDAADWLLTEDDL
jgi:hypothetical protein